MPTLITFAAGTPILSADVNANFTALNTVVSQVIPGSFQLLYGPTIGVPDTALYSWFSVVVTNAAAHAFAAPINLTPARMITLSVYNATGAPIATATFDAATYRVVGYVAPAVGIMTSACFIAAGLILHQITPWTSIVL